MKRNIRVMLIVLVVLAIAGATYGFAAENNVPATNIGVGSKTIAGYQTTNIQYVLNDATNNVSHIKFTLDKVATVAQIQTVADQDWTLWTCGVLGNGTSEPLVPATLWNVDCTPRTNIAADAITELNVYAADEYVPGP